MNRPNDSPPSSLDTAVAALRLGGFVARCLAYPHEVLMRKPGTMGRDYRGRPEAALGLVVVPWLTAAVIPPTHGRSGSARTSACSWSSPRSTPGCRPAAATGGPSATPGSGGRRGGRRRCSGWGIGFALLALCPTVGGCQLIGTACGRWHLESIEARDRRRVEAMKDAQMEAELLAERMRWND